MPPVSDSKDIDRYCYLQGVDRTEQKFLLVESSGISADMHRQCVATCEDAEG